MGDESSIRLDVIEAALVHVVQNQVEVAIAERTIFVHRRISMDDWSHYLSRGAAKDSETSRLQGDEAIPRGGLKLE